MKIVLIVKIPDILIDKLYNCILRKIISNRYVKYYLYCSIAYYNS